VAAARKLANPEKWKEQRTQALLRYRVRHKERLRAIAHLEYQANPDRVKERQKKYLSKPESKIKRAKLSQKWREEHPGYYREYWKRYRVENRDRVREYNRKAKALRRGSSGADRNVMQIIRQWKSEPFFQCTYCDKVFDVSQLHIDHIIPVSRGGTHSEGNICKSCPKCNRRKSFKNPEEFAVCRYV
jgi:5-methylcytosine-specific restriction endonuclease McrA